MYDHPFLWGSKRTGPDLARVGERYSDEWQDVYKRQVQGRADFMAHGGQEGRLGLVGAVGLLLGLRPVSYTHLDVYKRQCWGCDRYCSTDELACGNGSDRTMHPAELLGDDWYTVGNWGLEDDDVAADPKGGTAAPATADASATATH